MLARNQRSTRTLSFHLRDALFHSARPARGPNDAILQMLRAEKEREEQTPTPTSSFKISAFNNAINVIGRMPQTIKSGDDAILEATGIGIGIKNRINEYFVEHDLATTTNDDERDNILKRKAILELKRLPGIGPTKAKALVNAGCRGVESLMATQDFLDLLSPKMILGLKYLDHLDKPVSREHVDQVLPLIKGNLSSKYEIIPVGGYRRGLPDSPSMTFVILHPGYVHVPIPTIPGPFAEAENDWSEDDLPVTKRKPPPKKKKTQADRQTTFLQSEIISVLQERRVLGDVISESQTGWTGVVRIPSSSPQAPSFKRVESLELPPGEYRRITIQLVPQRSRAAGLLKFTGDEALERMLQARAKRNGMHLDQYGLWKWKYTDPTAVVPIQSALENPAALPPHGFWSLVDTFSEQCIFRELEFAYVDPTKRNFNFIR